MKDANNQSQDSSGVLAQLANALKRNSLLLSIALSAIVVCVAVMSTDTVADNKADMLSYGSNKSLLDATPPSFAMEPAMSDIFATAEGREKALTLVENYNRYGNFKQESCVVLVDIQGDFMDGSLAAFSGKGTENNNGNDYLSQQWYAGQGTRMTGDDYVAKVNAYLKRKQPSCIIYSLDYHPHDHCSFSDKPKFWEVDQKCDSAIAAEDAKVAAAKSWPAHCVQGKDGSKLHANLNVYAGTHSNTIIQSTKTINADAPKTDVEFVSHGKTAQNQTLLRDVFWLFKGLEKQVDSYSAVIGNDKKTSTGLKEAMIARGYMPENTEVIVLGIAYDFCVKSTAIDMVTTQSVKSATGGIVELPGYRATVFESMYTAAIYATAVDGVNTDLGRAHVEVSKKL